MTEIVGGTPTRTEPAPPASLTAISIKARRRMADLATAALPAGRKSGDLTRHLEREAAAAAAATVQPRPVAIDSAPPPAAPALVVEPSPAEPAIAVGEAELPPPAADESGVATVETTASEAESSVSHDVLPKAPVAEDMLPEPHLFHDVLPEAPVAEDVLSETHLSHDALPEAPVAEDALLEAPLSHELMPEAPALTATTSTDSEMPAELEAAPEIFDEPPPEPEIVAEPPAPPVSAPPTLSVVRAERPEARSAAPIVNPAAIVASPVPHAPEFSDIAGYWRSLCGDRVYPSASAIDRDLVSKRWPGTLMISFARTPGVRDPSIGGVARLGNAGTAMQEAIDSGSYAIEWMIEVGRAALAASAPLEELQRLPTRAGTIAFRLLALPLGAPHAEPDTVLCHLAPAAAAPRFGKRRNWLAA